MFSHSLQSNNNGRGGWLLVLDFDEFDLLGQTNGVQVQVPAQDHRAAGQRPG